MVVVNLANIREMAWREAERGACVVRPAKLTAEQIALDQRLIDEGQSARDVAKMFKAHAATLYRALSISAATAEASPRSA